MDCGALKRMAVALGFVVMVGSVVVMEVVSVGLLYFCSKE